VASRYPPVPASDEDAEVGAELGERGGRGASDAAGAAEHEHAGGPRGRSLHLGSVPGGGCGGGSAHGGRRRACSDDHAHGGHSVPVGLSPRLLRSDGGRKDVAKRCKNDRHVRCVVVGNPQRGGSGQWPRRVVPPRPCSCSCSWQKSTLLFSELGLIH
jgi:hypothetical protein